jgi:hypothetical protein
MTIRRLPAGEWGKLRPIFASGLNELPPPAETSAVVVAEEGGEIVGLLTGQYVFHIEPLWVKESHRGRYLVPRLVSKLLEELPTMQYAFSHTESPRVEKLLKLFGMKELPWKTFRWVRG